MRIRAASIGKATLLAGFLAVTGPTLTSYVAGGCNRQSAILSAASP
jgi:hypothetical protein